VQRYKSGSDKNTHQEQATPHCPPFIPHVGLAMGDVLQRERA
jgi:hypothetical protein